MKGHTEFNLKNPFDIFEVLRSGPAAVVTTGGAMARTRLATAASWPLPRSRGRPMWMRSPFGCPLGEYSAAAGNAILAAVAVIPWPREFTLLLGGTRLGMLTIGSSVLVLLAAVATWLRFQL